ncbi:MAG: glycine--tRNA ligase subunit beta [Coriobacteriaceae bacterium]|nr:glycine--tRNA ligase subunit beta [Coriobacteriaceae bacterium]
MATATLLFEIGCEEIPALPLYQATEQLGRDLEAALDEARIPHGEVTAESTPRRLVARVAEVAETSEALSEKAKGPSASIAFDDDGQPTKAAVGFARGKGIEPGDLVREADESGTEYVYACIEVPACPVSELLPEMLASIIEGIKWPKSQRWGSRHETFSRPIRWLVALWGSEIIDLTYAGLSAGNVTHGHRIIADEPFELADAHAYADVCKQMSVVVSASERADIIREQIAGFEKETGLTADTPEATFDEVVNLVEYPSVLLGHFDEEFLEVPPEIITDAMLEHQRYFPMYRADGSLDNAFLLVSNGNPANADVIREGNERVVRARLADAAFFVTEDRLRPLEDYVERLEGVVFQERLGTVRAKVERIEKLAAALSDDAKAHGVKLSDADVTDAVRAAHLCKADLVTSAVVEFTSLQGVMGMHYAHSSGETDQVADAIADHYRPRFSGDELPRSTVGRIVAAADKLDTICGLFAVDQAPTGSSDPFALRRAALGIVAMLLDEDAPLTISLVAGIDAALDAYEAQGLAFDRAAVRAAIIDFFITRTRVMLRDAGCSADACDAVLAIRIDEPVEFVDRVHALEAARKEAPEEFEDLATAYARANNLRDATLGCEVDDALLTDPERALLTATDAAAGQVDAALAAGDYPAALSALATLRGPIDTFFDDVLVMDEDAALRDNRLRLLNRFAAVFERVADISKLSHA